jgi:hypothetical protein
MHPGIKVTIIFSGGNSGLDKPYKRTEAQEMTKLFKKIYSGNKRWKIRLEKKSLSSLENQVFSKKIVEKIKDINGNISIFSDSSRVTRAKGTAKLIFGKVSIIPINLSSKIEHENQKLIAKKEKMALQVALWSLKSKANFDKSHKIYVDKFKMLRTAPKNRRKEAEIEWWKKSVETFKEEAAKYIK